MVRMDLPLLYFNRLIAGIIINKVEVDSIRCDFTNYPYQVKTYARQRILRESSVTERSLVTTCQLVNATRSDNNPQGFLIERFNIIENKALGTYDRLKNTAHAKLLDKK